jgi:solute carrier family 8 (sodium/calcium exchanger)
MVHYTDIWHVAKGLRKRMVAKTRDCPDAKEWIRSTLNHMYYTAAHAPLDDTRHDFIGDMWQSLENHVHNTHQHHTQHYRFCRHGPIEDLDGRDHIWLERGTRDSDVFIELVSKKQLECIVGPI